MCISFEDWFHEMQCPYCGSRNIVWDYSKGTIICVECGSVLDSIYEYDATDFMHSDLSELMPSYAAILSKKRKTDIGQESVYFKEKKFHIEYEELIDDKGTAKIDKKSRLNSPLHMFNVEDFLPNELVYIVFDKISRLGLLPTQLEKAVLAYYLVFGYESTLRRLGGDKKAKDFIDKILKKLNKNIIMSIKVYLDNMLETIATPRTI